MNDEKIKVRVTSTGQTLDVVVFSKRFEVITVVLGEGVHNMRCSLTPTRNGFAYAGSAMGRENGSADHGFGHGVMKKGVITGRALPPQC